MIQYYLNWFVKRLAESTFYFVIVVINCTKFEGTCFIWISSHNFRWKCWMNCLFLSVLSDLCFLGKQKRHQIEKISSVSTQKSLQETFVSSLKKDVKSKKIAELFLIIELLVGARRILMKVSILGKKLNAERTKRTLMTLFKIKTFFPSHVLICTICLLPSNQH